MFKNPGGKLRIIVRIVIYICMIVSIILSFVFLGGYGFLTLPVLLIFWWIVGLFWLLKIDQANDVHKIRMLMEERAQSKPAPANVAPQKRNIVKPSTPPAPKVTPPQPAPKPEYPSGAEVVYCPSCGKSQHAGNKKCFACGAEIKKMNS